MQVTKKPSAIPTFEQLGERLVPVLGHPWITLAGWTAAGFLLFAIYYIGLKGGQPTLWPGSYEYSQVARNIADGRGLVTNTASVLEFWFLGKAGMPIPYFFHDAGNSLLLAVFFKVFGARDSVIGLMSGTFFILCVPLTFLFASKLFNRRTAVVAALLVLVNTELLVFSVTGHSEVPYAFFFTLFLYLLYTQRSRVGLVLTGAVLGALVVLRSNTLPFLPWFLLFLVLSPEGKGERHAPRVDLRALWQRKKQLGLSLAFFLLGFLLVFTPNTMRNYTWMHSPLYNVNSVYSLVWYTSAIQGKSQEIFSMPGLNLDPAQFMASHPGELVNKIQYNWTRTIAQLLEGGVIYPDNRADAFLILLFLLSLFAPPPRENVRDTYFRWMIYACIVTALLVGSAFNIRWRHLYGFIPIVMIYVGEFITRVIGAARAETRGRGWANALAIAVLLLVLVWAGSGPILANVRPADSAGLNHRYRQLNRLVSDNTPASALILTQAVTGPLIELQNALAWYSGRRFVEYSGFTANAYKTSNATQPIFLLVAASDPDVKKSLAAGMTRPGFVPVAYDKDETGKLIAILFRRE